MLERPPASGKTPLEEQIDDLLISINEVSIAWEEIKNPSEEEKKVFRKEFERLQHEFNNLIKIKAENSLTGKENKELENNKTKTSKLRTLLYAGTIATGMVLPKDSSAPQISPNYQFEDNKNKIENYEPLPAKDDLRTTKYIDFLNEKMMPEKTEESLDQLLESKDIEIEKILEKPKLTYLLYLSQAHLEKISSNPESELDNFYANLSPKIKKEFRDKYISMLDEKFYKSASLVSLKKEVRPLNKISLGFGLNHQDALDLFIEEGSSVYSMRGGIVVLAENGWEQGDELSTASAKGGNTVIIYNPETKEFYRYAHLEKTNVSQGMIVEADTNIGTVGHTGKNASKPGRGGHLHFEINKYNQENGALYATSSKNLIDRLKEK